MHTESILSYSQPRTCVQNLEQEVSSKIESDPRWKFLPYGYAYNCIALLIPFGDALDGFKRMESPEQIMFRLENWDSQRIKEWEAL